MSRESDQQILDAKIQVRLCELRLLAAVTAVAFDLYGCCAVEITEDEAVLKNLRPR